MAKLGEGDPRWIVSERKDGSNVNSWHWEERDLTKACHAEVKAQLKGLALSANGGDVSLTVKEVTDLDGDVTIAQRKGKIMCYFELKLTLKWTGSVAGNDSAVAGKVTIPEIEHDNFEDDFPINISVTETNAACQRAEQVMRTEGRAAIRNFIKEYFKALFAKYHVGMNAKTGLPATPLTPAGSAAAAPSSSGKPSGTATAAAASPPPSSGEATNFSWKIEWRCPIDDLWGVLTDERRASAYTRSPAKIDPQASGGFEFLGGAISGYFVQVEHPTRLTLQWRLQNWAAGHFSSVVILLEREEAGVTRMEFAQTGIPAGELERVKQGWHVNFWEPIKMMFGFHYVML